MPNEEIVKVIGRHCYAAGMTETALLAAAGRTGTHSPLNGVIERLLKKDSADTQSRSQREHARKPQPALYSADVYARIVQSYTAPVPTPRNITFGFWGTWKHNNSRITQPTAWDAVFRVHGSGRTWPEEDHHLATVLDSATGRHYADQVAGHHPKNDDELDQALRDAGDPRDLWQKQNHHKQSAGATS